MTIFEFIRSRGWEPLINGRWSKPESDPLMNTLTFEEVLARLLREDTPKPDPVEEQIRSLRFLYGNGQINNDAFEENLRQLVALARDSREKK